MRSDKLADFRYSASSRLPPKAVADGRGGMLLAQVEVPAPPERVFDAILTPEVERWWRLAGVYQLEGWKVDLRRQGSWRVNVALQDGRRFDEWGEICEVEPPYYVVMTRRFAANPLIGERETTLHYRFDPSLHGTLITVREEGFVGRPDAAHGNAANWEKVLGWLHDYLNPLDQREIEA